MKIISKFHDYYDSCMAYGQDQSVVYDRKTLEFDVSGSRLTEIPPKLISNIASVIDPKKERTFLRDYDWSFGRTNRLPQIIRLKNFTLEFSKFRVLFCGKLYLGIKITSISTIDHLQKQKYFYSITDVMNYLATFGVTSTHDKDKWITKKLDERFDTYFEKQIPIDVDWLIEHKVTCVMLENNRLTVNPNLKDLEFYRVFDSYTCYQELDMWLSGTLAWPQNMIIEIEDKYKVLEHGFDPKYGFRTRPHANK